MTTVDKTGNSENGVPALTTGDGNGRDEGEELPVGDNGGNGTSYQAFTYYSTLIRPPEGISTDQVAAGIQRHLLTRGSVLDDPSVPGTVDVKEEFEFPQAPDPHAAVRDEATIQYLIEQFEGVDPDLLQGIAFDFDETIAQKRIGVDTNNLLVSSRYGLWKSTGKIAFLAPTGMKWKTEFSPTLLSLQTALYVANGRQPLLMYTNAYADKIAKFFNAYPQVRVLYMGDAYANREVNSNDIAAAPNILTCEDTMNARLVFLEAMDRKIKKVGLWGLSKEELFAYSDVVLHGSHASKHDVFLAYTTKTAFLVDGKKGDVKNPGVVRDLTLVDNEFQVGMNRLVVVPRIHPEGRLFQNPIWSTSRLAAAERAVNLAENSIIAGLLTALEAPSDEATMSVVAEDGMLQGLSMTASKNEETGRWEYPTRHPLQRIRLGMREQIREYDLPRDRVKKAVGKLQKRLAKKGDLERLTEFYHAERARRLEDAIEHQNIVIGDERVHELEQQGWTRNILDEADQTPKADPATLKFAEEQLVEILVTFALPQGSGTVDSLFFDSVETDVTSTQYQLLMNGLTAVTVIMGAESIDLSARLIANPKIIDQLRGDLKRATKLVGKDSDYLTRLFAKAGEELADKIPLHFRGAGARGNADSLRRALPAPSHITEDSVATTWVNDLQVTDHLAPALHYQTFGPRLDPAGELSFQDQRFIMALVGALGLPLTERVNVLDPSQVYDVLLRDINVQESDDLQATIDAARRGEDNELRAVVDGLVAISLIYTAQDLMREDAPLDLADNYYPLHYALVRAEQAADRVLPSFPGVARSQAEDIRALKALLNNSSEILTFLYKDRYDHTGLVAEDWPRLETLPREWLLQFFNPNGIDEALSLISSDYPRALVPEVSSEAVEQVEETEMDPSTLRVVGESVLGMSWASRQIEKMERQRLRGLFDRTNELTPNQFESYDDYVRWVASETDSLERSTASELQNAFFLYSRARFEGYNVQDGMFAGTRDSHFNRPVDLYYQMITPEQGPSLKGTVLVAPNQGITMAEYFNLAESLLTQGFNVMLYDPRGQGLSTFLSHAFLGRDFPVAGYLDSFDALEGDLERASRVAHQLSEAPLMVYADGRSAQNAFNLLSRHPENVAGISDVVLVNFMGTADPYNEDSWFYKWASGWMGGVYHATRFDQSAMRPKDQRTVWDQTSWNTPKNGVAFLETQADADEILEETTHLRRHGSVDGLALFQVSNEAELEAERQRFARMMGGASSRKAPDPEELSEPVVLEVPVEMRGGWGAVLLDKELDVHGEQMTVAEQMGLETQLQELPQGEWMGIRTNQEHIDLVVARFEESAGVAEKVAPGVMTKRARKNSRPVAEKGTGGEVLTNVLMRLIWRHRKQIAQSVVDSIRPALTSLADRLYQKVVGNKAMSVGSFLEQAAQAFEDVLENNPSLYRLLQSMGDLRQVIADAMADMVPTLSRGWNLAGEYKDAAIETVINILIAHPDALTPLLGEVQDKELTPMGEMASQLIFEDNPPLPETFGDWQDLYATENAAVIDRLNLIGSEVEAIWADDHDSNLEALFASVRQFKDSRGFTSPAGGLASTMTTDKGARQLIAEAILERVIYRRYPEFRSLLEDYLTVIGAEVAVEDSDSEKRGKEHARQYRERLFGIVDYLDKLRAYQSEENLAAQIEGLESTGDITKHVKHKQAKYQLALSKMSVTIEDSEVVSLDSETLLKLLYRSDDEDQTLDQAPEAALDFALNPFNAYVEAIIGERRLVQEKFKAVYEAERGDSLESFKPVADAEAAYGRLVFENETIQRLLLDGEYYATPEERLANREKIQDMMERFQVVATYHRYQSEIELLAQGEISAEVVEQTKAEILTLAFNYIDDALVREYYHYKELGDQDTDLAARALVESRLEAILVEERALEDWYRESKLPGREPLAELRRYKLEGRLGLTRESIQALGRDNPNLEPIWKASDDVQAALLNDRQISRAHVFKHVRARLDFVERQKQQVVAELRHELIFQVAYYQKLIQNAQSLYFQNQLGLPRTLMSEINLAYQDYTSSMSEVITYAEELLNDEVNSWYFRKVSLDKAAMRAYLRLHSLVYHLTDLVSTPEANRIHAYSAVFPAQAQILENAKIDVETYGDFWRVTEEVLREFGDGLEGKVNVKKLAGLQHRYGLDGLTSFFRSVRYGFSPGVGDYFNFKLNLDVMEKAWADGVDVDIVSSNKEKIVFRFKHGLLALEWVFRFVS